MSFRDLSVCLHSWLIKTIATMMNLLFVVVRNVSLLEIFDLGLKRRLGTSSVYEAEGSGLWCAKLQVRSPASFFSRAVETP